MPQRSVLAEASANTQRRPHLSPYERGRIVQAHEDGQSLRAIACEFQRAPATIMKTIQMDTIRDHGKSMPRPGRPRICSTRDERRILRCVHAHPFWSYSRVKLELQLDCSLSTIYRVLDQFGIRK